MPRYTDIDKLLESFDENQPMNWTDTETEIQEQRDYELYRSLVDSAQTVEVSEVVRCEECQHHMTEKWDGEILYGCKHPSGLVDVTLRSFCSYGERRK